MKSWRKGQTYFNVLTKLHPELAEEVRGSKIDPFYNDERLPEFFKFITNEFNDSEIL